MLQKKQNHLVRSNTKQSVKKKRLYSGNELDSDRPMRKRGKHREYERKKLTCFKKIILNERRIRMQLMNESKLMLLNFNKIKFNSSLDNKDIFYHLWKRSHFSGFVYGESSINDAEKCSSSCSNVIDDNYDEGNTDKNKNDSIGVIDDDNIYKGIDPKVLIHSRKFEFYCDQWPCKEMTDCVHNLIRTIVKFQDHSYKTDPDKAQIRRRYVCGFQECFRNINVNKAKLIVIASDIECRNPESHFIDKISEITKLAETLAIPYVYSGSRWSLKSCFKKNSPISCAVILNYEGAEVRFHM